MSSIPNFQISKHFSFHEMTTTNKLAFLLDNAIKAVPYLYDMTNFLRNTIEPIRDFFGVYFTVTSGFRCEGLNNIIKGEKTSYHLRGLAIDIALYDLKFEHYVDVCNYIAQYFTFGKLILEKKDGVIWIHIQDGKECIYYHFIEGAKKVIKVKNV